MAAPSMQEDVATQWYIEFGKPIKNGTGKAIAIAYGILQKP
jgi:hypothetical protein